MQTNIHHPEVARTDTIGVTGLECHVVELKDRTGGRAVLFIDGAWTEWDAMVAAVENHRRICAQRLTG